MDFLRVELSYFTELSTRHYSMVGKLDVKHIYPKKYLFIIRNKSYLQIISCY